MPVIHKYLRRRGRESPVFRESISRIMAARGLTGIEKKRIVFFEPGSKKRAIAKFPSSSHRITEAVARSIDELLGWNLVPPTVARDEPDFGGIITVQEWVPGARKSRRSDLKLVKNRSAVLKIVAFDYIIGNADRHPGNVLVDGKGKLWAIDHSPQYSFEDNMWTDNVYNTNETYQVLVGENKTLRFPEYIMRDLRNLDEGDLRAATAPLKERATAGVIRRWKKLVRTGQLPKNP